MTPAKLPSGEYLLIDVPEDKSIAGYLIQHIPEARLSWLYFLDKDEKQIGNQIDLLGHWELIGKGDGVTEEIAAGIVDSGMHFEAIDPRDWRLSRDYYMNYEIGECEFDTALESFNGWIRSYGKEPKQTVIIKKV